MKFDLSHWKTNEPQDYGLLPNDYDGLDLWKANGQVGCFDRVGSETVTAESFTGIILQATETRKLWAPDKQHDAYHREKKYKFPEATVLCQWKGGSHEVEPNTELTDKQKARLSELGVGTNCSACQADKWSDWNGERVPPLCRKGLFFLFLPKGDENSEIEPVKLQISARSAFQSYEELTLMLQMQKVPLHAVVVKLSFEETKSERGSVYHVLKFTPVEATPEAFGESIPLLKEKYDILKPKGMLPEPEEKKQLSDGEPKEQPNQDEPPF